MRKPHYIKLASATRTPNSIVCFDTETHVADGSTEKTQIHTLTLGCAIYYRREKGKRTRVKELTFYDTSTFWEWLKSLLSDNYTTWVFAHNSSYDLGIVDAWREFATDQEWGFRRVIVERGIVLLDGEYAGMPVVFSDTGNYWKTSLANIGKSVGRAKMEMPATDLPSSELERYCRNDTLIVADAVDSICEFIDKHNYGPFGPTAASLAYNTWRKRFMGDKILVHTNKDALELERESYYGGIVDTPYIGDCPGSPIYELDVVSMYPSCCMGNLPTKLVGVYNEIDVRRLRDVMEKYMVIGRVKIKTDYGYYPRKNDNGVIYPIGEFYTTLADAEFRKAFYTDRIVEIDKVAVYERAPLFKDYMTFFLEQKMASTEKGDKATATLHKLLLNSLYGKMGQLTPRWVQSGREAETYIETVRGLPAGSLRNFLPTTSEHPICFWQLSIPQYNILLDMRSIFGIVEVNTISTETRDSCPSIAACVTSLARMKLRGLQEIVGYGNYFYCDTDSIWVNTDGYHRLAQTTMIGNECGQLQLKGKCKNLRVFGRKDYHAIDYSDWNGASWSTEKEVVKRKGVKKSAIQLSDDTFIQEQWPGIVAQLISGQRGVVEVQRIGKTLHRSITHCHVDSDGWTRPFTIRE